MTCSSLFFISLFVAFVGATFPAPEVQLPLSSSSSGLCEGYLYTTNLQICSSDGSTRNRVAELSNGKVVVIYGHAIGTSRYISGKLINPNGTVEVSQESIATWRSNLPFAVAPIADGGFVVAWAEEVHLVDYIRYRIFDGDFQVVSGVYSTTKQIDALNIIAFSRAVSGFGIAWRIGEELVYASLFDSSGTEIASDVVVADINGDYQGYRESYDISPMPDGKFVIVYYDESDSVIKSQLLDTDLSAIGTPNVAASDVNGYRSEPLVAKLGGNGLVLTYLKKDVSYYVDIYGQYLNDDATVNGSSFIVNTFTYGTQEWTDLAAMSDGGFVLIWESVGQYSSWSLFGRVFGEDREPKGTEFTIMEDYNDGSVAAMGEGFISCGRDYVTYDYEVKCSIFQCTDVPNNSSWSYTPYSYSPGFFSDLWFLVVIWYAIWYGPVVIFIVTVVVIVVIIILVVVLAIIAATVLSVFINRQFLSERSAEPRRGSPIFVGEMDEIIVVPTQSVMGITRQPVYSQTGYVGHPGAPPSYYLRR